MLIFIIVTGAFFIGSSLVFAADFMSNKSRRY